MNPKSRSLGWQTGGTRYGPDLGEQAGRIGVFHPLLPASFYPALPPHAQRGCAGKEVLTSKARNQNPTAHSP